MATRTYQPTLRVLARGILLFVARYRVQIDKGLTSGQKTLLDALVNAAEALLSGLPSETIGD